MYGPGGSSTILCPDRAPATPDSGAWTCKWNLSATHGDEFQLTMHAVDRFGEVGNWTSSLPFRVDTQPPSVTIDYSGSQVAPGGVVRGGGVLITGAITDNAGGDGGIGGVTACTNGGSCKAVELQTTGQQGVTHEHTPASAAALSGCASPIVSSFTVTESFAIDEVQVGFRAEALHRDLLRVDLTGPDGRTVRLLDDDGRSGTDYQNYDVNLFDTAARSVSELLDNQALSTAFYSQDARPVQPLRAFAGLDSAAPGL